MRCTHTTYIHTYIHTHTHTHIPSCHSSRTYNLSKTTLGTTHPVSSSSWVVLSGPICLHLASGRQGLSPLLLRVHPLWRYGGMEGWRQRRGVMVSVSVSVGVMEYGYGEAHGVRVWIAILCCVCCMMCAVCCVMCAVCCAALCCELYAVCCAVLYCHCFLTLGVLLDFVVCYCLEL
jgi:hypothetical protein